MGEVGKKGKAQRMNVTMYEVNFGEAILYEENGHKLLVDCGAKYETKGQYAYDRVRAQLDAQTDLLITHFDEDHYNGILCVPNGYNFHRIYLPRYIYKNGRVEETFKDMLKVWTYFICFGRKKKITELHKFFLKLPKLVHKIEDISCVGAGEKVPLDRRDLEVLWPRENTGLQRASHGQFVAKLIREKIRELEDESFDEDDEEKRRKIEQNIEDIGGFLSEADAYVEQFLEIYRIFCNNHMENGEFRMNPEEVENGLETLEEIFQRLLRTSPSIALEEAEKKRLNSIASRTIKNMNECSIVFKNEQDVIAFGDVTPPVLKYLKKNKILKAERYKLVKVPHHGTKDYWSDDLPKAKAYLISNSGVKQPRWKIFHKYGEEYHENVRCTNKNFIRCKYYQDGGRCANCNIRARATEISLDLNLL